MTLPVDDQANDTTLSVDDRQAPASRWQRARLSWARAIEPTRDGLPNRRVIAAPLALLALIFVGLVAFGITGSSTGAVHQLISSEADTDLLAGAPQPVRSDEWFVQTSWVISQVQQGLPIRNESLPGGMDATVQHDLPTTDWSTAFRPHLLGFFALPLDQAMAVKWWLPAVVLIASAFLFAVSLLPRRPGTAMMLSLAFFFSPFFQWWYLSTTLYPAAWAFLAMATIVWACRSTRRAPVWVLAGFTAYLTVALGTGVYVPFIVPAALVVLAFGVGSVLDAAREGRGFWRAIASVVPVFAAGAAGAVVLGVWAVTRWDTIVAFTSTVYPGERLQPVGAATARDVAGLLSGFASFGLNRSQGAPFDVNASEASTFLLPGLFLLPAAIWFVVDRRRRAKTLDWLLIALVVTALVMVAYFVVPGWDLVAHASALDRTTYGRIRIGFGILSLVLLIVIARRADDLGASGTTRAPWWVAALCVGFAAASLVFVGWVAAGLVDLSAVLAGMSPLRLTAGAAVIIGLLGVVWAAARGRAAVAAVVLLGISVASSGLVNPLYRGVVDLRETPVVQEIQELDAQQDGAWVGINTTYLPTMMLVESGVTSFNGVQSAPPEEMWQEIDPTREHEAAWNRLGNVNWVAGSGSPDPRNPYPDQIQMTFDSCASFAQAHVTWVISELPVEQACLAPVSIVEAGPTVMHFYRVSPSGS